MVYVETFLDSLTVQKAYQIFLILLLVYLQIFRTVVHEVSNCDVFTASFLSSAIISAVRFALNKSEKKLHQSEHFLIQQQVFLLVSHLWELKQNPESLAIILLRSIPFRHV